MFIADESFDLELVYYTLEDAGFSLVYSINEADYVIISREVLNSCYSSYSFVCCDHIVIISFCQPLFSLPDEFLHRQYSIIGAEMSRKRTP